MDLQKLLANTYAAFSPPSALTVSEWADAKRILSGEYASAPGVWRTDFAPYQREIMDAFTQAEVHEIVIMSSAQVGKSEMELNMMGRAIDIDPGPILYVQPTDKVAEDYSKRRIAPMIAACPALKSRINAAKSRDSSNTVDMKTFPGGSLAIIGANSPADLSSKPIRYIFFDEIDRFPDSAGTEGNPIKLAERRTEAFRHNRKIVKCSTPTIKGKSKIEDAYMDGTQEEWQTECPHCKQFSFIRFDDILFGKEQFLDEEKRENWIVSNPRWRCPVCKHETSEVDTKRCAGKWVPRNEKALKNGIRSFRLNAFMSPWSDWSDIALTFLKAKNDPNLLQVFHNTMLGESWELRDRSNAPEKLMARREYYNAEVPTGTLVLTMGVDTQDNRLEYEVVGWAKNEESWGIARGVIPGRADSPGVWDALDELLDREWAMANGMRMRILATFVDSGGHFTQDVYRACAKRAPRHVWAIKGDNHDGVSYVRLMKKGDLPQGAVGFMIGVNAGKEAILFATGIEEPGARYMHFPIEESAGYGIEYFRGLCSEKQVIRHRRGEATVVWEKIYERNEPLDCRNYARAAFKYFHWNFAKIEKVLSGEPEQNPTPAPEEKKRKNRRCISRGIQL